MKLGKYFVVLFFLCSPLFGERSMFDYQTQYGDFTAVQDEDFPEFYETVILPHMNSIQKTETFTTKNNTELKYYFFPAAAPKGTVVIFHGFSEYGKKFLENAFYFNREGYNVCLFDHRGHGNSTRDIKDDLSKVYIERFDIYVSDAKDLIEEIVIPETGDLPLILYAHSMGGCVGVRFLETYPEYFDMAILNAPMLEIELGNYPAFAASAIANSAVFIGLGKKYVPGHTAYNPEEEFVPDENYLYSKTRNYEIYKQRKNNPLYQTNGATFNWLRESIKATKQALKKENTEKINVPVLLFQADHDVYVKPGGQDKLEKAVPSLSLVFCPGTLHEMYLSPAEFLTPYYSTIFNFIEKNTQD